MFRRDNVESFLSHVATLHQKIIFNTNINVVIETEVGLIDVHCRNINLLGKFQKFNNVPQTF